MCVKISKYGKRGISLIVLIITKIILLKFLYRIDLPPEMIEESKKFLANNTLINDLISKYDEDIISFSSGYKCDNTYRTLMEIYINAKRMGESGSDLERIVCLVVSLQANVTSLSFVAE